jgi:hypothetical protein
MKIARVLSCLLAIVLPMMAVSVSAFERVVPL